jgi:diacylglycerol kinase family enzyme
VLAAAALVLVPTGVVLIAFGFVRGMPELLLAAVIAVAAAWSLWWGLGHRRVMRWVMLAAAVVLGLASMVAILASRREVLWIGLGAAVLAAGSSSAGAALVHAPRRDGRERTRSRHRPRRAVLFVNPRSGGGTAERVGLAGAARSRGIEVVELGPGDDLRALARHAVERGADCLGAAGGDGTLALVAEVAIEADVPFVCIPAGTRNHFALDLGLDRSDPLGALDAFTDAYTRRIDVAEVNGRLFLNNVSIGAYGEIVADEQYREKKVGTALAKLPELIGPEAEPLDLRFTDGEGNRHESAVVVLVSNNAYELGPRRGFGTRPSLSDGELGIVAVVRAAAIPGGMRVLRWSSPSFSLDSSVPVPAGLDGESVELDPPVGFGIRPRALRVRMPVHAVGLSPAAARPRWSTRTVSRLVLLAGGRPLP